MLIVEVALGVGNGAGMNAGEVFCKGQRSSENVEQAFTRVATVVVRKVVMQTGYS